MSKKQSRLVIFDQLFNEFLNDLDKYKPGDSTLYYVKMAISVLSTETLVDQFMEIVGEYSTQILSKDESFFLETLPNDIDSNSFAGQELNKVTQIWKDPNTNNDTKKIMWNYMCSLLKLGQYLIKC